jgi:hypothetical protein
VDEESDPLPNDARVAQPQRQPQRLPCENRMAGALQDDARRAARQLMEFEHTADNLRHDIAVKAPRREPRAEVAVGQHVFWHA